jgi:hypothetical protein
MHLDSTPSSESAKQAAMELVPPSLLRVRAFLFEHGMPIIPWATAGEVLEDLHELLRCHKADDAFWQSAHELVLALNIDLRRLQTSPPHNALLDCVSEQALLDEIRSKIDAERSPSNNFLSLSRGLTQACLPALLLLAGAATVSCGARTDDASNATDGTATGGTTSAVGTGGNSGQFILPAVGGAPQGGASSSPPVICAVADSGTGAPLSPDASPGSPMTMTDVQTIARQCINSPPTLDLVLQCLSSLNSSWQTGVEAMLNCKNCEDAAQMLVNLTQACPPADATFAPCALIPSRCMVPVYMGVRMF